MQTFLYARVSTADQNIGHQRAQAEAAGYVFDEVIADEGVSGVSTRFQDRDGGRRLLDKLRRGDVLVVRWVDRLGRNYEDVTETIQTLMKRGVVIKTIINAMTFDGATKDPIQKAVRDALVAFMAATAQAQAEATREAQKAGIRAARESAAAPVKYRGRKPTFDAQQLQRIHEMLSLGLSPSAIASEAGVSRQTVYRVRDNSAAMASAAELWSV